MVGVEEVHKVYTKSLHRVCQKCTKYAKIPVGIKPSSYTNTTTTNNNNNNDNYYYTNNNKQQQSSNHLQCHQDHQYQCLYHSITILAVKGVICFSTTLL